MTSTDKALRLLGLLEDESIDLVFGAVRGRFRFDYRFGRPVALCYLKRLGGVEVEVIPSAHAHDAESGAAIEPL